MVLANGVHFNDISTLKKQIVGFIFGKRVNAQVIFYMIVYANMLLRMYACMHVCIYV